MPRDMSLIGFDDYAWMRARATPLTAIFQPVREMGRALWDTLSARITGDLSPANMTDCRAKSGFARRLALGPMHIPRRRRSRGLPERRSADNELAEFWVTVYPEQSDLSIRNLPARQTKGGK